jgi:chromate transporter
LLKINLYFVSVSQVTPGPIAINMATFIGYEECGFLGAVTATTGVAMPSFLIITIIAASLKKISSSAVYRAFITGIKPVIAALLIGAIYLIINGAFHSIVPFIMAIVAFAVFMKFKINAFLFLIIMGTIGIFLIR